MDPRDDPYFYWFLHNNHRSLSPTRPLPRNNNSMPPQQQQPSGFGSPATLFPEYFDSDLPPEIHPIRYGEMYPPRHLLHLRFPDPVYNPTLTAADFTHLLNLSTRGVNDSLIDPPTNTSFQAPVTLSDADLLQRRRVESAVRGQNRNNDLNPISMDDCVYRCFGLGRNRAALCDQTWFRSAYDHIGLGDSNYHDSNHANFRRGSNHSNGDGLNLRLGDNPRRNSGYANSNGIRFDSNARRRGRSSSNGFESENSSVMSSSSLYNNYSNNNNNNNNHQRRGGGGGGGRGGGGGGAGMVQSWGNLGSMEELRGKIVMAAKDRQGCSFLQERMKKEKEGEGMSEEVDMIYEEVKDHICELMVDQFANYLIQGLLKFCNEERMTHMLLQVADERQLMSICCDMYGTRAMQKFIEHLTTQEQKSLLVSVLRRITVYLTKSLNGHHVLKQCLKLFSNDDNRHILNVVADNCLEIAMDQNGCCVLQHCVQHSEGESQAQLVHQIVANSLLLADDRYGNYVVQYVLGMKSEITADIVALLRGSNVSLSMNKYGSNVVEKCLKESGEFHASEIVKEIINSPKFLTLVLDPFGNYVAQSALEISKGALHHTMRTLIEMHSQALISHPFGKKVLMGARNRVSRQQRLK